MAEKPYKSTKAESGGQRRIAALVAGVAVLYLIFRVAEWRFSVRAQLFAVMAALVAFGVAIVLTRRWD